MAAKHPAAFINAIAEEGTKKEAVQWLQKIWDANCELRKELGELQKELEELKNATKWQELI